MSNSSIPDLAVHAYHVGIFSFFLEEDNVIFKTLLQTNAILNFISGMWCMI